MIGLGWITTAILRLQDFSSPKPKTQLCWEKITEPRLLIENSETSSRHSELLRNQIMFLHLCGMTVPYHLLFPQTSHTSSSYWWPRLIYFIEKIEVIENELIFPPQNLPIWCICIPILLPPQWRKCSSCKKKGYFSTSALDPTTSCVIKDFAPWVIHAFPQQ